MHDAQAEKPAVQKLKARWKHAAITLSIVALVVAAWAGRAAIFQHVGGWWAVSDDLAHADAIVVLGGDFEVRPFAAAALYKRGLAPVILVSNVILGRAERLGFVPTNTDLNRDILLKLGVPAASIVAFGQNLSSTQQEAAAIRQWALQAHSKRVIVPTGLFASRRTRWVFDRELTPIGVQVLIRAYRDDQYTLDDWWQYRDGLVDFNNEVLKYLYYRLRF